MSNNLIEKLKNKNDSLAFESKNNGKSAKTLSGMMSMGLNLLVKDLKSKEECLYSTEDLLKKFPEDPLLKQIRFSRQDCSTDGIEIVPSGDSDITPPEHQKFIPYSLTPEDAPSS